MINAFHTGRIFLWFVLEPKIVWTEGGPVQGGLDNSTPPFNIIVNHSKRFTIYFFVLEEFVCS